MVPALSVLFMCITLFLSLFLPVIFLLILQKREKNVFSIWVIGALGFFIPQLVIRIPLLQILGALGVFNRFAKAYPYLYVFILALTAGLFESTGRLIVLKKALADKLSYMTGLVSGAGHGGIESMTITGITYMINLIISFLINNGKLSLIVPSNPDLTEIIRSQLTDASPVLFLMAGIERVFAMIFHIAVSILLTLFIIRGKTLFGYLLATFLHFLTDFLTGIMQINSVSVFAVESMIFIIALISLIFIVKIRPFFGERLSVPTAQEEQAVKAGH